MSDEDKLAMDLTRELLTRKEALLKAAVEYNAVAALSQSEAVSIDFRQGFGYYKIHLGPVCQALGTNISPSGRLVNKLRRFPDLEEARRLRRDLWPDRASFEAEYLQTPEPDRPKEQSDESKD